MATPSRPGVSRTPPDVHRTSARRAPTARGLVVIGAVPAVLGAVVDASTGSGPRVVFGVLLALGCLAAALLADRRDLGTVVVMPPLIFAASVLVAATLDHSHADAGSWLTQEYQESIVGVITAAPYLFLAEGLVVVVAFVRRLRTTR